MKTLKTRVMKDKTVKLEDRNGKFHVTVNGQTVFESFDRSAAVAVFEEECK